MGRRRRNLFILLFVLGLVGASALVIATKKTQLGLDLRGRRRADLPGPADPAAARRSTGEAIERSIDIIRERIDAFGVAEPEISRLGADQISVGLPDVTERADGAIDQVGTTAQLYFYDWEPNLLGPAKEIAGTPAQPPPSEASPTCRSRGSRPSRDPNARQPAADPRRRVPDRLRGGAVRLQAAADGRTAPSARRRTATTSSSAHQPHDLIAGPETKRSRPLRQPDRREASRNGIVLEVPQGTAGRLRAARRPENDAATDRDAEPGLVRDQGPPGAGRDRHHATRSRTSTRPTSPNVTFDFTDKGGTSSRTSRGRSPSAAQRQPPARHRPNRGCRTRATSRSCSTTRSSRGRSSTSARTRTGSTAAPAPRSRAASRSQEAQDLAKFLKIGALPIDLKLISQSEVSATLGQQALDQGLKAGIVGLILVVLFLLAFYRFLGVVAGIGAGRLRGHLLRADQADPDHADAAGHRRADPHDRGRGRLQHRHLRANKGGGARRADRCPPRSPPATAAASRRSSTRT